MEPPIVIELLQDTIRWLKENPDKWIQYHSVDGRGNYCAMGAMRMISGVPIGSEENALVYTNYMKKVSPYLSAAGCELYKSSSPAGINDCYGYDAIIEVFELALKKAIMNEDTSWTRSSELHEDEKVLSNTH